MKILIVEDNNNLRELIKRFLEKNRYIVDEADNGKQALQQIKIGEYDCVLLDLNLPGIDGLEVAKKVRETNVNVPIVILTARSQIYNKLEGFDIGADDYITKPFDMKELLARINAVVRRSSENKANFLKFGSMSIYPEKNEVVTVNKKAIFLSNKEMGVLEYMIRNKGRIVSSEELLEHVWDREVDFFSDTVKTHMKTLRKKLDQEKKHIKTVRGKGYIYEN
jgi:DNA-binding response OmpR family regulator